MLKDEKKNKCFWEFQNIHNFILKFSSYRDFFFLKTVSWIRPWVFSVCLHDGVCVCGVCSPDSHWFTWFSDSVSNGFTWLSDSVNDGFAWFVDSFDVDSHDSVIQSMLDSNDPVIHSLLDSHDSVIQSVLDSHDSVIQSVLVFRCVLCLSWCLILIR